MHKPKIQQKTERRISAGLRLALVAVLLLAQIALVVLLSMVLRQRMAVAYTVLELLAIAVAVRIYMKPGRTTSYKLGWILLVLAVPVAGLILYFLWNGDRGRPRAQRGVAREAPPPLSPVGQARRLSLHAGFFALPAHARDVPPHGRGVSGGSAGQSRARRALHLPRVLYHGRRADLGPPDGYLPPQGRRGR